MIMMLIFSYFQSDLLYSTPQKTGAKEVSPLSSYRRHRSDIAFIAFVSKLSNGKNSHAKVSLCYITAWHDKGSLHVRTSAAYRPSCTWSISTL